MSSATGQLEVFSSMVRSQAIQALFKMRTGMKPPYNSSNRGEGGQQTSTAAQTGEQHELLHNDVETHYA
jgi:hypothetical protein